MGQPDGAGWPAQICVLTANQAVLWQALRLAGLGVPVVGYGQIFTRELPPRPPAGTNGRGRGGGGGAVGAAHIIRRRERRG